MSTIYSFTTRSSNALTIKNANNGQTIAIVSVDGEILGSPNVSGDTGVVNVKKGNVTKAYVYNLKNGSVKNIYAV
jgi:hypothetical protein